MVGQIWLCLSFALVQLICIKAYPFYYVKDVCNMDKPIRLNGTYMSAIILKLPYQFYSNSKSCKFAVQPYNNNYGIVTFVNQLSLKSNIFSGCYDYMNITYDSGKKNTGKSCKFLEKDYVSRPPVNKPVQIEFSMDASYGYRGFEIMFTQYRWGKCNFSEFQCDVEKRCIWDGLRCDNHDNCGDYSDEICGYTSYTSAIVGGVIGIVIVICVCAAIFFIIRKRRTTDSTTTYLISPTPMVSPATIYNPERPPAYPSQGGGYNIQGTAYYNQYPK